MRVQRCLPLRRIAALAICTTLLMGSAACAENEAPQQSPSTTSASNEMGNVGIFTPKDGITLSQSVPLNKWNALTSQIETSLVNDGFEKGNLNTSRTSSLDDQSQDIQDYVVHHVTSDTKTEKYADAQNEAEQVTLIVAPVTDTKESTKLYGDYVTQPDPWEHETKRTLNRLSSALQLAKESGFHVIVVGTMIPNFTPDAYIELSSAQQIGELQAKQLANKLQLDNTSKHNPKYVEILLPVDSDNPNDKAFAHQAFQGIWSVLGPYLRSGQLRTPSLALTHASTEGDWENVVFVADKPEQIQNEVQKRLTSPNDKKQLSRVDGIIAMNDYVASLTIKELDALGYTGTAADINPSITISGILGNITGKHDLNKQPVPDPAEPPAYDHDEEVMEEFNAQWPIITGYGAYISNLPNIVNGKQWMTGLENRNSYAEDIAVLTQALQSNSNIRALSFVHNEVFDDVKVPTVHLQLVSVSANNLKASLIDPGYISLADAGL